MAISNRPEHRNYNKNARIPNAGASFGTELLVVHAVYVCRELVRADSEVLRFVNHLKGHGKKNAQ